MNPVISVQPADPAVAKRHFEQSLSFETDCWDVHTALQGPLPGFVLVDARSEALYEAGHIEGALSIPHRKIISSRMASFRPGTLFVTYCGGPHCNAAARAAASIAALGFPVKLMIGGLTGWTDEGFRLVQGRESGPRPA